MSSTIVVSGVGVITPLGNTTDEIWSNLMKGMSAASEWEDLIEEGFRNSAACRIPSFQNNSYDRGKEMAIAAVENAINASGIQLPKRTGVFVGSTIGESLSIEKYAEGKNHESTNYSCLNFARGIKKAFDLNGPCRAYGTACAAGNYAISAAAESLKNNLVDVAIAGGVDPFSRIAMAGFSKSRAMSSHGVCRPFDINRKGMLLGEGAAFLILERLESALKRGANLLGKIGAIGLTCDAFHPTAPKPGGIMMEKAMEKAILKQGVRHADIGWVCAHGSGTLSSDATEALAISNVFGNYPPPVSAFKGAFGHTMGAATAIEAVVCLLSLQKNTIPPTVNCQNPDPTLPIEVVKKPIFKESKWVLNCGFAFGGLNSALLIGK